MNKEQRAWAFYDWANSVYSLVIATAVFPLYFEWIAPESVAMPLWLPEGWRMISSSALYSFVLAFSFLSVAILLPILGGLADSLKRKKIFMQVFLSIGSLSCMGMYFFVEERLWLGLALSYMASIGFWSSLVFYNAYLPEIAEKKDQDMVSARGFSLGYLGSSILLLACLALILTQSTDEGKKLAFRLSFVLVGVWWMGFSQYSLRKLPADIGGGKRAKGNAFQLAYKRLKVTYQDLKKIPFSQRYILSFFLFSVGVQTIILIASLYGSQELQLESAQLIGTILLIQIIGIGGATFFGWLSGKWGNIPSLMLSVAIWIGVCIGAFVLRPEDPMVLYKFYALAALVGWVMGGTQSLSRSTFSKLLPSKEEHTAYFSFMEVAEKLAIVTGTALFGIITQWSGEMRYGALSLSVFFVLALVVLQTLKKPFKKIMAGEYKNQV